LGQTTYVSSYITNHKKTESTYLKSVNLRGEIYAFLGYYVA